MPSLVHVKNTLAKGNALAAYKFLNGLLNVYKPPQMSTKTLIDALRQNLSTELNAMDRSDPQPMVRIASSDNKTYSVDLIPNLAQHVLSTGPRFPKDMPKMFPADTLGFNSSGVLMVGINKGTRRSFLLKNGSPVQTYHVSGKFGTQTETNFAGSLVTLKATYDHVTHGQLNGLLASLQTQYQKIMFAASGVSLQSQEAYDLACKGVIRPKDPTHNVIYGIKLIRSDRERFTIEVNCMNVREEQLSHLICQIALGLRTVAHCTKIRRTRYGYFSYENALVRNQWHLPDFLQSIADSEKVWNAHPDMISDEISTPVGQNAKVAELH